MTQPSKEPLKFETLRAKSGIITDGFVIAALTNQLPISLEQKTGTVKLFADQVGLDQSDHEFLSDYTNILSYRDCMSDFIADNLKIFVPRQVSDEDKTTLKESKTKYLQKLTADKAVIAADVEASINRTPVGSSNDEIATRQSARTYKGLTFDAPDGKRVNLLTSSWNGVRSNIQIQDQTFGWFIMWDSDSYIHAAGHGSSPKLTQRIYLNPRIVDTVSVFQEVMDRTNDAGLSVKAKMQDRTYDLLAARRSPASSQSLRGDGVVIYATEPEADDVLNIITDLYREKREVFQGRAISRFPMRLADGFAVGDEPLAQGESLATHRSKVLEQVFEQVREKATLPAMWSNERYTLSPEQEGMALAAFRSIWPDAAISSGINPGNLAFNK